MPRCLRPQNPSFMNAEPMITDVFRISRQMKLVLIVELKCVTFVEINTWNKNAQFLVITTLKKHRKKNQKGGHDENFKKFAEIEKTNQKLSLYNQGFLATLRYEGLKCVCGNIFFYMARKQLYGNYIKNL